MSATADAGRAAIYAAEQQVRAALDRAAGGELDFFGSRLQLPAERRFADLAEVQAYLEACCRDDRVVAEFGEVPPVRVRPRAGDAEAHYELDTATVAIAPASAWALREMVVLHEFAHHLLRSEPGPVHGGAFLEVYPRLVEWFVGAEVALVLRTALHATGAAP